MRLLLFIVLFLSSTTVFSGQKITGDLTVSGNIGVGSLAPGQKLDVVGTIRGTTFTGKGSTGPRVIVASQYGCAINSNITTGGGTDDSVCLQNALNALATAGGGELVIDGVALISNANVDATVSDPIVAGDQTTALQIGSGTTIRVIPGGGVFLAASSNCPMLGNLITGDPTATYQTNMQVIGGTWNGNATNQAANQKEKGTAANWYTMGFWFGGFNGLTIRDLVVKDATTYGIYLTQGINFVVENVKTSWTPGLRGGKHYDGIHMDGDMSNGYVHNYESNGDDDVLALNTDEGYYWYQFYAGQYGIGRFPRTAAVGAQSNITFDGIFFNSSYNSIRLYANGSLTPGIETIDNITFRNIYGNVTTNSMPGTNGATIGKITIDGWMVTGHSLIQLGNAADTIKQVTITNAIFQAYDNSFGTPITIVGPGKANISNVNANATVNTGTENSVINDMGTTILNVNNVTSNYFAHILQGSGASLAMSNITQTNFTDVLKSTAVYATSKTGDALPFTAISGLTVNKISKGLTANTLQNSQIFDDGTNVGIGTLVPGKFLDVVGPIRVRDSGGKNYMLGDDNTMWIGLSAVTGGDMLLSTASNTRMAITNGGNIGIGSTAPGQKLDLVGNQRIRATNQLFFGNDNNQGMGASANTGGYLYFTTNANTVRMIVSNGGNVGIGSLAPGTPLDVNGVGRMTGLNVGIGTTSTTRVCLDANKLLVLCP